MLNNLVKYELYFSRYFHILIEKYRIFSISKQSENEVTYLTEYIADTETDVLDLHHIGKYLAGSTCFIIVTSAVYMLGNDDIWHEI